MFGITLHAENGLSLEVERKRKYEATLWISLIQVAPGLENK
jgi:hypothetical protein